MKNKILFIVGMGIDLTKKGVDNSISYYGDTNLLSVAFWVGVKSHENTSMSIKLNSPTLSKIVLLTSDTAHLELDCIIEYMSQLLQKVSE
jgi:hypothetical protein